MSTASRNANRNSTPAPAANAELPVMSEMEMLKTLMAKFSKADIAKLTKEVISEKHTVLSVTMTAIAEAVNSGQVLSKDITERATTLGRECGVFDDDEAASPVSTAQLIRHVQAYNAAVKRLANEAVVATAEFDVSTLNTGEQHYVNAEQPPVT
jgi:hypothetical protein